MATINSSFVGQVFSGITIAFHHKTSSTIVYDVGFSTNQSQVEKIVAVFVKAKLPKVIPPPVLRTGTNIVSRILNLGSENVTRSLQEAERVISENRIKPAKTTNVLISIPIESTSDFIVEISGIDSEGLSVSSKVSDLVLHSRIVSLISRPMEPPKVLRFGNRAKFEILQRDQEATGIQVLEKTLGGLNQLTSIDLLPKQTALLELGVLGGEYCFVSKNGYGVSSDFFFVDGGKSKRKLSKQCISYQITGGGIQFKALELGAEAVALRLYKKYQYGDWSLIATKRAGQEVSFFDQDVVSDNVYQYRIELESLTSINVLRQFTIRFKQTIDGAIAVTPIKTQITTFENEKNVEVSLKTEFVEADEQRALSTLRSQGISNFFDGDITKENLQSLLVHAVSRLNLETGLSEDLGIITGTDFSVNELARSVGASGFENSRYQLQIISCIRKAETVLDADERKWKNPVTLRSGTLLASSLEVHHAENQFLTGPMIAISYVEVDLRMQNRQIENVRVVAIGNGLYQINWQTNGQFTDVFYFLVQQREKTVARVLPFSGNETIVRLPEINGAVSVTVTPVFLSGDVGSPTQSNVVRSS